MKILFTIDTFSRGGKERRLLELMKGLKDSQKIDFELIILSNKIDFKELLDLKIAIHLIERKTKKDVSVFSQIFRLCKKYKPDLVHCWDSMSAVYLVPTITLLSLKFVNGMVTDAPGRTGPFNKYWLRAQVTFPFSDLIIGNSQAGLKAYNVPMTKGVCIHNGFNFERINALIPPDKIRNELGVKTKYIIGMVASFSEFKDYATYFRACQNLLMKRTDVTFLAIGKDTDCSDAKILIEEQNRDHFKLLGTRSDIESLINCMDVCVLATFTEGISNSILEYMALGKPVVVTSGGGTIEIVDDNRTGFLIDSSDPVAFAEKIELLLNNDMLRIAMGEAGRRRVHDNFSIERMVHQFVINYEKIRAY